MSSHLHYGVARRENGRYTLSVGLGGYTRPVPRPEEIPPGEAGEVTRRRNPGAKRRTRALQGTGALTLEEAESRLLEYLERARREANVERGEDRHLGPIILVYVEEGPVDWDPVPQAWGNSPRRRVELLNARLGRRLSLREQERLCHHGYWERMLAAPPGHVEATLRRIVGDATAVPPSRSECSECGFAKPSHRFGCVGLARGTYRWLEVRP